MTLGMCPTLQLPLATHFQFFMNFSIFSIKKIFLKKIYFPKNIKLCRLEGMIFLSLCAKYLVQSPSISSKNALGCAMACPWGAKASHGLPQHALVCAMACLGVCHGMPWCVPRQVMRVTN
jgi:hypothetical protein